MTDKTEVQRRVRRRAGHAATVVEWLAQSLANGTDDSVAIAYIMRLLEAAALEAAHQATVEQAAALTGARQRRDELAAQRHHAGCSYKWLGQQIGVTAQAVEGFVMYRQRQAERLS